MTRSSLPTEPPRERAFLVGVDLPGQGALPMKESLAELELLAKTAGLDVVGSAWQSLPRPNPKTFLGTGKVQEIKEQVDELVADVVIFDEELSPRHQRELERIFGENVRILDRTALILDIFAQHAQTREGALQVELAQYEYRLPRLTRAWTHLARQAGGGGGRSGRAGGVGLRGPGETQLEVDRRVIRQRISRLRSELEKVRAHRGRYRARRRRADIPTVAIVGYTNAGKSTLLNALSEANVYVADELFATLDPTTRRVELPGGKATLLTDTVGFIQKLPTTLIAAFRATLEEIQEADLILHVVDLSHISAELHAQAVRDTLEEIGAQDIPRVTALNKIDLLSRRYGLIDLLDHFDRAVPISAKTGEGLDNLLRVVEQELFEQMVPLELCLPYGEGRLLSLFHEHGLAEQVDYHKKYVEVRGKLPRRFVHEFRSYLPELESGGGETGEAAKRSPSQRGPDALGEGVPGDAFGDLEDPKVSGSAPDGQHQQSAKEEGAADGD